MASSAHAAAAGAHPHAAAALVRRARPRLSLARGTRPVRGARRRGLLPADADVARAAALRALDGGLPHARRRRGGDQRDRAAGVGQGRLPAARGRAARGGPRLHARPQRRPARGPQGVAGAAQRRSVHRQHRALRRLRRRSRRRRHQRRGRRRPAGDRRLAAGARYPAGGDRRRRRAAHAAGHRGALEPDVDGIRRPHLHAAATMRAVRVAHLCAAQPRFARGELPRPVRAEGAFDGSDRQWRGRIMELLRSRSGGLRRSQVIDALAATAAERKRARRLLRALCEERLAWSRDGWCGLGEAGEPPSSVPTTRAIGDDARE